MLHASLFAFIIAAATAITAHAQDGFATYGGSVTGGSGGPSVTVTTLTQLTSAIGDDSPRIVTVSGTINLGTSNVRFGSNKTIRGADSNSGFIGNLKGVSESNVIIQRLNFTNPNGVGDADGLGLEGCTRIWIDHCSFVDCGDGSLDIKRAADLITVSWCKFTYTFNSGHNFVNLVGHSDSNGSQDRGKLRITFHHNWWGTGCVERMPRVRFGRVHVYNNYYNAPGNNNCIRAAIESEILAENNYFENVDEPFDYYGSTPGKMRERNNVFVNVTNRIAANDTVFSPPYSYSMNAASDVKSLVMNGAGSGGSGSTPPPSGGTYTKIRNRATGLMVDGMGRTSNGSNCGQYSSGTSYNQQWTREAAGSYYKFKNRSSGLYIDGMGHTANGSVMGQWSGGTSYNQQWTQETVGSYVKYRNRATGLYMDGMGRTANGSDLGQWSGGTSYNQQWQLVTP